MSKVYSPEEKRELAKALDVQSACNLSGVLHSWAKAATVVQHVLCTNRGEDFNKHPINILYMSKIASLLGVNADCLGGVEGYLPIWASKEEAGGMKDLAYWAFGEASRVTEEKEEGAPNP
jgi:hypothetical protein